MGRERQGGGQGASVKVMGRLDWEFEIMILIRIMDLKSVSLCEKGSARCGKKQIKFTRRLEGGERGGSPCVAFERGDSSEDADEILTTIKRGTPVFTDPNRCVCRAWRMPRLPPETRTT